jgi:hypothetical protein
MNECSVQVVISEPGGRQVRVNWQGAALDRPLVLQLAALSVPVAPTRHELFPAANFPAATEPRAPSAAPAICRLELHWSEPPPPAVQARTPPSEPAPLDGAWAAERLRHRHLASATGATAPLRRRVARAAGR